MKIHNIHNTNGSSCKKVEWALRSDTFTSVLADPQDTALCPRLAMPSPPITTHHSMALPTTKLPLETKWYPMPSHCGVAVVLK